MVSLPLGIDGQPNHLENGATGHVTAFKPLFCIENQHPKETLWTRSEPDDQERRVDSPPKQTVSNPMRLWRSLQRRLRRYVIYRLSWSVKSFLIAGVFWFVHLVLFSTLQNSSLEFSLLDCWFRLRGQSEPPHDIVIVSVTEQTYQALGRPLRESFPRKHLADVLEQIARHQPRLVMVDTLLAGSAPNDDDAAFAAAIAKMPTVIGTYPTLSRSGAITETDIPPAIRSAAKLVTSVALLPGSDDVVRSPVVAGLPPQDQLGMGRMVRLLINRDAALPDASDLIRYYGVQHSIPTIDATELLSSTAATDLDEAIRDKVVFLGYEVHADRFGSEVDQFRVPVRGGRFFGVEIHATVAANILEQRWIRRMSPEHERALLGGLAFALAFFILRLRPSIGGVALLGTVLLWGAISYTLFLYDRFLPGVTLFLLLAPLLFSINAAYSYAVLRRQFLELNDALGMSFLNKK